MSFKTEKEVESLLQLEQRSLERADGSRFIFQGTRQLWAQLDYIKQETETLDQWITKRALQESQSTGQAFEILFPVMVRYMYVKVRSELELPAEGH